MSETLTSDERESLPRLAEETMAGMTEDAVSEEMLATRMVELYPELDRADADAAARCCFDHMAARELEAPLAHADELEKYARATGRGW